MSHATTISKTTIKAKPKQISGRRVVTATAMIVSSVSNNITARKITNGVVKALKEVKEFESGKKKPKSFDDFLNEI